MGRQGDRRGGSYVAISEELLITRFNSIQGRYLSKSGRMGPVNKVPRWQRKG